MLRSRLGAGSRAHLAGLPRGCVTLRSLLGAGCRWDVQEGCRRGAQVECVGRMRRWDVQVGCVGRMCPRRSLHTVAGTQPRARLWG